MTRCEHACFHMWSPALKYAKTTEAKAKINLKNEKKKIVD